MSTDFPTPTILCIWRRLTSARWSSSRTVTVAARTQCCCGAPIAFRSTSRRPGDSVESQLRSAVVADAVRLDIIAEERRPELADASQLTESLRLYDSSYHAELSWWTGPFETREGVPHSSLVSAPESDRVDIGRNFPVTDNTERRLGFGRDHSKILVLSTYENGRDSVLRCGETLSAVLLDATMAGLATCTLTHITELGASRNIVAGLIEQTTTPQVLIRVGQIPQIEDVPPATPRRPIDEVFELRSKDR